MVKWFVFFWLAYGITFSVESHAQLQTPEQLLRTLQTSLVEVRTSDTKTFTNTHGKTRQATYSSEGHGIIIDSAGLIVTNTHIIAGSAHILVGLSDGSLLAASVVYSSDADFSFLKVDPPYPLSAITWEDSSAVKIGTPIIALNTIDETHQNVLSGLITNTINGITSDTIELLELNITLEHGDSGGPLLDSQGQCLGLIMAKKTSEDNKTYAIASNKIQKEYLQYKQNG